MKPSRWLPLANFLLFQLGWFACVLGAAQHLPWLGPLVVALLIATHLVHAPYALGETKLIACALAIGLLWESLLLQTHWISYAPTLWPAALAPAWILALWAIFATTLNVSMRWLHSRWLLAALLGAIAGPLSYLGGARLGAATLVQPFPALLALALGWAFLMPLLLKLAQCYDGPQSERRH